jgi:hypothetical protein
MEPFHASDFMALPRWQQYALFRQKLAETRWKHFLQPIFLKIKHWSPHPTLKLVNVRITDDGESSRLLRE